MWKVLNSLPYSWHMYQTYIGRFKHTEVIRHVGFTVSESDMMSMLTQFPDTYLVHGNGASAGTYKYQAKFKDGVPQTNGTIYWNGEISPATSLSILLRTFSDDFAFAAKALASARLYIPHAIEFVVVVPQNDEAAARANISFFPAWTTIIAEPKLLDDGHMQQKYTKLMADTYCKGKFILHLDSDVVFVKQMQVQDILFLGKPILEFARYTELPEKVSMWRQGTAVALARDDVTFEFSRDNTHVYPRELYKAAREFIFVTHKETLETHKETLVRFLGKFKPRHMDLMGEPKGTLFFSDFNFLGAFAYYLRPDLLSFFQVGAGELPVHAEPYGFSVVLPQRTCQGNARFFCGKFGNPARPDLVKRQLELLELVGSGKAHCSAVEGFLVQYEGVM